MNANYEKLNADKDESDQIILAINYVTCTS